MSARLEFTGTIEDDASVSETIQKMKTLVKDIDPAFRVNIIGGVMLGSANQEAYTRLFGPIAYVAGRWRLTDRPEIHSELKGLVRTAGPNREVTTA